MFREEKNEESTSPPQSQSQSPESVDDPNVDLSSPGTSTWENSSLVTPPALSANPSAVPKALKFEDETALSERSYSEDKSPRRKKNSCDYCRSRHRRCDGAETCYECAKRKIPCVKSERRNETSSEIRRVRDPQRKGSLKKDVEPKRKEKGTKGFSTVSRISSSQVVAVIPQVEQAKEQNSTQQILENYLKSYLDYGYPIDNTDFPSTWGHAAFSVGNIESTETATEVPKKALRVQLQYALALGAEKLGKEQDALYFIQEAKNKATELADEVDYEVARSFFLLGCYYLYKEDAIVSCFYVTKACKILETLQAIDTPGGRSATLSKSIFCRNYEEKRDILFQSLHHPEAAAAELIKAITMLVETELQFRTKGDCQDLLSLLNTADEYVVQLREVNPFLYYNDLLLVNGCRLAVLLKVGAKEQQAYLADQILDLSAHPFFQYIGYFGPWVIALAISAHMGTNNHDRLERDFEAMRMLSTKFPSATEYVKQYSNLFSQEQKHQRNPYSTTTPLDAFPSSTHPSSQVFAPPALPDSYSNFSTNSPPSYPSYQYSHDISMPQQTYPSSYIPEFQARQPLSHNKPPPQTVQPVRQTRSSPPPSPPSTNPIIIRDDQ